MRNMTAATILVAGVTLLLAAPAQALRIRTTVSLLAWSSDGESLLLLEREQGPEGGGSTAYLVVGTGPVRVLRSTVSSNFSPGDGSEPERVPVQDCRRGLKQLASALGKLGFRGVKARPARCALAPRSGLITGAEAARQAVVGSRLGEGGRVVGRGLEVALERGKILVTAPARKRPASTAGGAVSVALSAPGKVLLVLRVAKDGDRLLAGIYRSDSGDPAKLGRIQLRRPKGGKW